MLAVFGRLIPLSALCALMITPSLVDAKSIHERRGTATVVVAFAADQTEIPAGESVLLSWSTSNARRCEASGGWEGKQSTEGSYRTSTLTEPTTFTLSCTNRSITTTKSLQVAIAQADPEPVPEPLPPEPDPTPEPPPEPEPEPEPSLALTADDAELRPGESTTLRWSGEAVSNCQASGSWSGSVAESGVQSTGTLSADATYTITCDGSAGSVVAVTSVLVTSGGATITWQPPTENVDGSPLNDLAAYRIYVGTSTQTYEQHVDVTNPQASSHFVPLSRGDYHVAMTAVDAEGNESAFSNEVLKSVY